MRSILLVLPLFFACVSDPDRTEDPDQRTLPPTTQPPQQPQPTSAAQLFAPGMLMPFAGNTAPDGWWICDGRAVSRDQYPELFKAIGSAWGNGDDGDGPLFNIPDLRGAFLRGVDSGAGRDPEAKMRTSYRQGSNAGDSVGSFQAGATAPPKTPFSAALSTSSDFVYQGSGSRYYVAGEPKNTNVFMAGGDKETRPLNVAVHYVIKH